MSNPINHLLSLVPSRYLLLSTAACVLAHTRVCVCDVGRGWNETVGQDERGVTFWVRWDAAIPQQNTAPMPDFYHKCSKTCELVRQHRHIASYTQQTSFSSCHLPNTLSQFGIYLSCSIPLTCQYCSRWPVQLTPPPPQHLPAGFRRSQLDPLFALERQSCLQRHLCTPLQWILQRPCMSCWGIAAILMQSPTFSEAQI